MVTVGVDTHKRTHTAVAIDENGMQLKSKTFAATPDGQVDLVEWTAAWPERRWAIEDCRHLSRRLEASLLGAGESVVRVPPHVMASNRRPMREQGKSDPIDALAVARSVLREPNLPVARLDGPQREIRLLVDHREDLVRERVRIQSRLRWHLHELQLGIEPRARGLRCMSILDDVEHGLEGQPGLVAELARTLVTRCRQLTVEINQLERRIGHRVAALAPNLLELEGCGFLTAAKIVGEVGGAARFRSRSAFARHNGTAPIPVWTGNQSRFRLSRGGNRQINTALHRIAVTQLQRNGRGRAYVDKRTALGDTKTEAVRALRRKLSDEVFRRMLADEKMLGEARVSQAA